MEQAIGNFLLRRLREVDIRHIFGVPDDYNRREGFHPRCG